MIRLSSPNLDSAITALGLSPCSPGEARLCSLFDLDRGIAARWNETTLDLMVHGGRAIVDAMLAILKDRGVCVDPEESAKDDAAFLNHAWPERLDDIEGRMLEALCSCEGSLALRVLLAQPERWRQRTAGGFADASRLRHLIHPPLVVVWGPANIGKSTLVNRLARETVSIVADRAGTTRDAVAALVEVDGLVVRMLDAPGVQRSEHDALVQAASTIARDIASGADLVLNCFDACHGPVETPCAEACDAQTGPGRQRCTLRVALRCDRGVAPCEHDLAVSAHTGEGIETLARSIRAALVPDEVIDDPKPWLFWSVGDGVPM
jgi:hypothetical protein